MNRRISQGQATRSTFTFCLVIHLMASPCSSLQGLIEALSQQHSAFKQFFVTQPLSCPPFHDFINSKTLFLAKLFIEQVCVVDDLTHHDDSLVTDLECFGESLKGTVL